MNTEYKGYSIKIEDDPKRSRVIGTIRKDDYFGRIEREYRKVLHTRVEVDVRLFGDIKDKTESWTTYDRNTTISELYCELLMCVDLIVYFLAHESEQRAILQETIKNVHKDLHVPDPDMVSPFAEFGACKMLELDQEAMRRGAAQFARDGMVAREARRELFKAIYDYLDDHTDISADDLDKVRYRFGEEGGKK